MGDERCGSPFGDDSLVLDLRRSAVSYRPSPFAPKPGEAERLTDECLGSEETNLVVPERFIGGTLRAGRRRVLPAAAAVEAEESTTWWRRWCNWLDEVFRRHCGEAY